MSLPDIHGCIVPAGHNPLRPDRYLTVPGYAPLYRAFRDSFDCCNEVCKLCLKQTTSEFDGASCAVKAACTVLSGEKPETNLKRKTSIR